MLKKVAFFTLGCKVNQYESQSVSELLCSNGYAEAAKNEVPDVVIINSCTVTAESDRKTRQAVRRYKGKFPNVVVVLMGCMPQAFPDAAEALTEADIVLGNKEPRLVVSALEQFYKEGKRIVKLPKHDATEVFNTPSICRFEGRTRAFMKIQDGCERFCTYCIIPFARGRVRSKSLKEIAEEAAALAFAGYSEVVLTGINLSAYGSDIDANLCDAVEAVSNIAGIERVRLGSLEPDLLTDEMLYRLKATKGFCDQFHLSLQSGDDSTLKRMNRHYDTAFYENLVERIRKVFDNPAITTDIMVGFAGEDDAAFERSLNFARKIKFAKTHVFAYSRRKGTMAYSLPNQVENAVKEERSRRMIESAKISEAEFMESQVGRECTILLERQSGEVFEGYSENYTKLLLKSETAKSGDIIKVRITKAFADYCEAVEIL